MNKGWVGGHKFHPPPPKLTHHYTAYNDVDHDPCVKILNSACQLKLGPRQLCTCHQWYFAAPLTENRYMRTKLTAVQITTGDMYIRYFDKYVIFSQWSEEGGLTLSPPQLNSYFYDQLYHHVYVLIFRIIHLTLKSYTFLAKRRCRWNATVSQEPSALAASALCFSGRPLLYRPPSALADSAMLSFCLDFSSHFF